MIAEDDISWMHRALELAELAATQHEVPVGAVLISENSTIIGEGYNRSIQLCDPTAHAEIIALRQGAVYLHNYRLINSTLYVTLEPCIMCIGALVQARVKRVVYGACDPKAGAVISAFEMGTTQKLNHKILYDGGVLEKQCGSILSDFFKDRRN